MASSERLDLIRAFAYSMLRTFVDTEVGQLISVTLESIPDLKTVTFSLILPVVTVMQQSSGTRIRVVGLTTTEPTTIAGPPPEPQKLYSAVTLRGTAQFIVS